MYDGRCTIWKVSARCAEKDGQREGAAPQGLTGRVVHVSQRTMDGCNAYFFHP